MPRALQRGHGKAGEDTVPQPIPDFLIPELCTLPRCSAPQPSCWPDFTESLAHVFTLFVLTSGLQGSPDELILVLWER